MLGSSIRSRDAKNPLLPVLAAWILLGLLSTGQSGAEDPSPGFAPHPPIWIRSDEGFHAPGSGVVAGSGSPNDPFIIRGWDIIPQNGFAIRIENTTKHARIEFNNLRDGDINPPMVCYLSPTTPICIDDAYVEGIGIELRHVSNVSIHDNLLRGNTHGITLRDTHDVVIARNTFHAQHGSNRPMSSALSSIAAAGLAVDDALASTHSFHHARLLQWPRQALVARDSQGTTIVENEVTGFQDNNWLRNRFMVEMHDVSFQALHNRFSEGELGMHLEGSTGTIRSNTFTNISDNAIAIQPRSQAWILSNVFTNTGRVAICGVGAAAAILDNAFRNASVISFAQGLGECYNPELFTVVEGNSFEDRSHIAMSSKGVIRGNKILHGDSWTSPLQLWGAVYLDTYPVLVERNEICCSQAGIWSASSASLVRDNTIVDTEYALAISGDQKPVARDNLIARAGSYAVFNTDQRFHRDAPPGVLPVDARWNWWDSDAGPPQDKLFGSVWYEPWHTT